MIKGLESLLVNWVSQGKMFTALDVSNEVKKTHSHVRHREVRDEVRDWMNAYAKGYTKTTIQVTEFNTQTQVDALLYHKTGDNPDNYNDRAQRATQPVKSNNVQVNTQTNVVKVPLSAYAYGGQVTGTVNHPTAGKKPTSTTVFFNKDRIRVPSKVISELNVRTGDGFKVTVSKGKIVLSPSNTVPNVRVTNDNRINVTSSWITLANLSWHNPFNVYVENGEVVISQ